MLEKNKDRESKREIKKHRESKRECEREQDSVLTFEVITSGNQFLNRALRIQLQRISQLQWLYDHFSIIQIPQISSSSHSLNYKKKKEVKF